MNLLEIKTYEWCKPREMKCYNRVPVRKGDPWNEELDKPKPKQNLAGILWFGIGLIMLITITIYFGVEVVRQLF